MEWWPGYLLLGAFIGFFAGLLGLGGGMIMVPLLVFLFDAQHFAARYILHMALGTAMATIVFTSISSSHAHHRHGAVNWQIVRDISPGILVGTLLGSLLSGWVSIKVLAVFFTAFVYYAATQMILGLKPKATRQLPGRSGMFAAGGIIGGVSSLVAAGGAVLSIPFMTRHNVKLHQAIGTSSAIGFPIAVGGTLGYIAAGMAAPMPPYSLGFVYLPALAGVAIASILTAPLGAKMAHRLPIPILRRIFAVILYILASKMLISLL
ncbi:MAG TPA: sulfite exporter TauE/SafE family protein [Acidiferrobacterales bacterium]|nr:sulfite exporter TauE/SafE family protein [Acidiferrobacterales bacterium]